MIKKLKSHFIYYQDHYILSSVVTLICGLIIYFYWQHEDIEIIIGILSLLWIMMISFILLVSMQKIEVTYDYLVVPVWIKNLTREELTVLYDDNNSEITHSVRSNQIALKRVYK